MFLFVSGNDSQRDAPYFQMVYPFFSTCIHTTASFVQMDRVYYVELQATNGAGLRRTILSKPIVLDTADPFGGRVKDGHSFDTDVAFQSQNTEMLGMFD